MVYENSLPTVSQGITVLFDIKEKIKSIICSMFGKENIEDKYLYFVGIEASQFRNYYKEVCKKCEDINQIFDNCGEINSDGVCPKVMFLFDDMNSCKNFRDYFEKIDDSEEKVRNELIYGSTYNISMTLSIFDPIT